MKFSANRSWSYVGSCLIWFVVVPSVSDGCSFRQRCIALVERTAKRLGMLDAILETVMIVNLQAYMHSRMRAKTSDFLKVLNRARPEGRIEKKTFS